MDILSPESKAAIFLYVFFQINLKNNFPDV